MPNGSSYKNVSNDYPQLPFKLKNIPLKARKYNRITDDYYRETPNMNSSHSSEDRRKELPCLTIWIKVYATEYCSTLTLRCPNIPSPFPQG